jgi:hypothetical protein
VRRRSVLISASLVTVAAVGAYLLWGRGRGGEARGTLAFARTSHDFGRVRQRQEMKTSFAVENRGGAKRVLSVRGDCACLVAAPSVEVGPRGRATIDVTFRSEALSGPIVKHVVVTADGPDERPVSLAVRADVSSGILVKPANFYFPHTRLGASPTATVRLQWKEGSGRPFRVLGVDSSPQVPGTPPLGVAFDAAPFDEPPWRGYDVTMRFESPPPVGMVSGTATIRTDDPETPTLQALIGGMVSGAVVVSPREVSFGIVPPGKGASVDVHVSPFDAKVDLGEVTATAEGGRVEVQARRNAAAAGAWIVEVRLPPSAPPGPVHDVVHVRTKVSGEEDVQVRVLASVRAIPAGPSAPNR